MDLKISKGNPSNTKETAQGSATRTVAITPDNSTDLAYQARAIWVGTGGDVCIDDEEGNTSVIHKNVASGTLLMVAAKRVRLTGTTATDLVAWS